MHQGRPPVDVERMLRLQVRQVEPLLQTMAVEEALYDSRALDQCPRTAAGREPVSDETTICKFRHLLEVHQLGEQLFARIGEYLAKQGLQVSRGTIVDTTISAPSSTKNRTKERDPDVHNRQVLPDLLHEQETRVWGDSAYSGQRDAIQHHEAPDESASLSAGCLDASLSETERARNRTKSKMRAKVEHAFLVIKRIFWWAKVCYRGLAKNAH